MQVVRRCMPQCQGAVRGRLAYFRQRLDRAA
jgi:hypothetical protein